ncbi:two-component system sensor histidine kinase AlgZ [Pseudoxanthomonas sacheonensis]|uniref:Two-component system sensor histidine kinase AlgZ n=1 Tax=Pseudoxanthomonas sacheonensis TaxID=443615 RepID=A0ABU1RMR7_9GAMM|nr:histidine kinase [Pseudoxanthomonas sacheonensis]MDR6840071.1 two-component system sensor histidine kinase AlgZ [Pseudoxanthomonas sacheonensis]
MVLTLAARNQGDGWIYFALTSMAIQWVSLLTLAELYLLRRSLNPLRPQYVAYVALGLLLINTCVVTGAAWLLVRDLWSMTQGGWQSLFLRLSGIALTVGLLGLAAFLNHWRARQLAVRAKQSELESLQARIRPHFLFNTLNAGAALIHARPGEAERLLLDLADLFRAALAGPSELPLSEELTLAQRYLEIEKLRFGERLRVQWQLPDTLPLVDVPTLSIQPLVENAIRHGVEPATGGGEICIEVTQQAGWVLITISNALPESAALATKGHQVGLNSVRARVTALTHGRGSVETTMADGRYIAVIRLPLLA